MPTLPVETAAKVKLASRRAAQDYSHELPAALPCDRDHLVLPVRWTGGHLNLLEDAGDLRVGKREGGREGEVLIHIMTRKQLGGKCMP